MALRHVRVEQEGEILWITLNRPDRLNALDAATVEDLHEVFRALYAREDVRVAILQGAGRAFCAGLDLKDQGVRVEAMTLAQMYAQQRAIRDVMIAMRRCPQPIIAIIQGAAAGGGFALALASDIRLATPDARMNSAAIRIGLSACDMGISYFLPRMVGSSVAAELLLTGRFLDARRALALGLVSQVAEQDALVAEARALAAEMLAATPLGLRLSKEALRYVVDAGGMEAAMAMEDRNQMLCTRGEDFAEGIAAFLEKRAPRYPRR